MNIITRDEVRNKKLKLYFTGKPCKHGHTASRYVSNNICVDCQSLSNQRHWDTNKVELKVIHKQRLVEHGNRYQINARFKYATDIEYRERVKRSASTWYKQNRDLILSDNNRKEKQGAYQKKHRERISELNRKWRKDNNQRVNKLSSEYQKKHRYYYNAKQATYRARKRLATPSWCEHREIIALYNESRMLTQTTGVPHQVDHIIPLVHPLVCGLHCIANLRIVTEHENKTKHNKFTIG